MVASRSTCMRRQVACIITDGYGKILSTGYNGVPSGINHCIDFPCRGYGDEPGNSSRCEAVHAEQNAIIQCADISRAYWMYCSTSPCFTCAKMILNTPIRGIFYGETYADQTGLDIIGRRTDIKIIHLKPRGVQEHG